MNKTHLILAFFLVIFNGISAQIAAVDSPYNVDGSYVVTADSNLTDISIPMLFYYPETAGNYPVFMFQLGANGFGASAINRHTYDIFMKHLASYGFVVIVLDDSQAGLPNGASFMEAHDWYTSNVTDPTHWLSSVADPTKFVVGGHSNGGVNACALLVDRPTQIDGIIFMDAYPSDGIFGIGAQDVTSYAGKEMTMAANENDPATNEAGYDKFTSVDCKTYVNIAGMDHGGFGDYVLAAQPVGPIGRTDATATIRHFLVSWMLTEFKNDTQASDQLNTTALHPNTIQDFYNDCNATSCVNTASTAIITSCDTYDWIDGNTYTTDNSTATHTIPNAAGCDSVITLNLTINSVSDLTTTLTDLTITTNNQNASAYQWVDCDDNNSPIANETNSSFTATQDGNYAVEITENGCVSTSACVSIATASISQNNAINMLIYPNPTKNSFILETANSNVVDQLIITNIAGQIVLNLALNSEQTKVNMAQLDAGTYLCTLLKNGKNMAVKRVVKED